MTWEIVFISIELFLMDMNYNVAHYPHMNYAQHNKMYCSSAGIFIKAKLNWSLHLQAGKPIRLVAGEKIVISIGNTHSL